MNIFDRIKIILFFLITAAMLYSGFRGLIGASYLLHRKNHIARNGVVTDGEIMMTGFESRSKPLRYKFYVEGYKNPMVSNLTEGIDLDIPGLEESNQKMNELLSTVVGRDFRSAFPANVHNESVVKVMYDPKNPDKNIGGDQRGKSLFELSKGLREIFTRSALAALMGIFCARFCIAIICAFFQGNRNRSNQNLHSIAGSARSE